MLDFGWAELFLVMAVGVLVIGPKEIPGLMRGAGKLFRRFQYMKHSFTTQFEDFMSDVDVTDVNFESGRAPKEAEFDEEAEDEDVMVPLDKKQVNDD